MQRAILLQSVDSITYEAPSTSISRIAACPKRWLSNNTANKSALRCFVIRLSCADDTLLRFGMRGRRVTSGCGTSRKTHKYHSLGDTGFVDLEDLELTGRTRHCSAQRAGVDAPNTTSAPLVEKH